MDQLGLLRKAVVTLGNRYDSPFLPELVQGLRPKDIVGDAAYDAESNRKACREIGAKPHITTNPPTKRQAPLHAPLCKRKRYIVEQFNSRFKEMLGECWLWFKGLAKKATIVYSALLAMNALYCRHC